MDENMALTPHETREILFYKTDNGDVKVEILLYQENLWLTQAKMAELFEVQKAAISKHLKNIFTSGELMEDSVVSVLETTAADGKNYPTRYYNLDAIIAVGYRVNSKKATMFRIWANRILKEYIIKGYVMDDERLKEPQNFFGKDYFEEQLERIRDIRASERRFYQKITDIYSQCSADYDVDSPVTKEFFATVQNKLHYAITKHTAAEIIYDRADSTKPNMGLTTWKNAPSGRIRKSDVVIAKNYLDETEMGSLNEIVTMYLDYAERQARRGNIMYMKDWVARLDAFLQFNEEEVLYHKGKVTAAIAKAFAESEVETFLVSEALRERLNGFIRKQCAGGHQVYVVCPAVEDGEENAMKSAEGWAQTLRDETFPELRVGLVHGRMKSAEKDAALSAFRAGDYDILVATTVVEVGVDVPNATLMVIENAERFGLSQLHQLRGRVGRGSAQSYCVLVSGTKNEETKKRLQALCKTTDGFKIAEQDLALRGPGDFFGSRQHGLPLLKVASLQMDLETLRDAQQAAAAVIQTADSLNAPELAPLKARVEALFTRQEVSLN